MTTETSAATNGAVNWRRAIEALRAGVPNRDAVCALGCMQPEIEQRFIEALAATQEGVEADGQAPGLLVLGDFGAGKSHLLEYLQNIAIGHNFICSKVVISKETPLHDPVKLFRSAMHKAVVPGRRGNAMTEIATQLRPGEDAYDALEKWAHDPEVGLNSRFAASLFLFKKSGLATELGDRILSFWSGDRIGAGEMNRHLKAYGERATYTIEPAKQRDLALQGFRFVPRLAIAAHYAGWVFLIDEIELIGFYSNLQRAKSYAELARWMGKVKTEAFPGLCTVLAMMSNFESEVLDKKNDWDELPERLRNRGFDEIAKWAESGMRAIRRDRMRLRSPATDTLQQTYDKVRDIHGKAHDWEPPVGRAEARRASMAMREHIRSWITSWDLERLYPGYEPDPVVRDDEIQTIYIEDTDLEKSSAEKDEAGAENTHLV